MQLIDFSVTQYQLQCPSLMCIGCYMMISKDRVSHVSPVPLRFSKTWSLMNLVSCHFCTASLFTYIALHVYDAARHATS